jgi:hypothetical protein
MGMRKNLPWIVGIFLAICFFAYFESAAFAHPDRYNTLSHFIASIGATWPFSLVLFGMFIGGLSVHFWWSWKASPMGDGEG